MSSASKEKVSESEEKKSKPVSEKGKKAAPEDKESKEKKPEDKILSKEKEELDKKLAEFASYTDNLEEIFENREQIEVSKFYEKLPKPSLIALQEFSEEMIYYRMHKNEEK